MWNDVFVYADKINHVILKCNLVHFKMEISVKNILNDVPQFLLGQLSRVLRSIERKKSQQSKTKHWIQFPNFEICFCLPIWLKPNRYNIPQINQTIEMLRITLKFSSSFFCFSALDVRQWRQRRWRRRQRPRQPCYWNMTQKFTLQNFEHTHTVNDWFISIVYSTANHARSDFFSLHGWK